MRRIAQINNRLRRFSTGVLLVSVFVGGFALGNVQSLLHAFEDTQPPSTADKVFEPFWQVYNLIDSDYITAAEKEKLVDGAIKGMVDALDDPFSAYMDPSVYPRLNEELSGEIVGIGVIIETDQDTDLIRVVGIIKDSPAQAAGIQAGDIFAAVDGVDVLGMNQTELGNLVRGEEGSAVTITMLRGEEHVEFTIQRVKLVIPTVEYRVLDGNIGYLRLNDFNALARNEMNTAFAALDVKHLNALIFDLRGNPGGLLSSAIQVASAFMERGVVAIESFGKGDQEQIYRADGTEAIGGIPLVVLVDHNSASASELVSAALKENKRATLVGEVTFGKGTVQTWQELVNGGGVRLTIAKWLTPDRNWIHQQGVIPDIKIDVPADTIITDDASDVILQAALSFIQSGMPDVKPPLSETAGGGGQS